MVKESDVVSADLRLEDVEIILGILCYDGKLEKFADPRSRQVLRIIFYVIISIVFDLSFFFSSFAISKKIISFLLFLFNSPKNPFIAVCFVPTVCFRDA